MQYVVCRIIQSNALNILMLTPSGLVSCTCLTGILGLIKQWQSLADGGLHRCLLKLAGLLPMRGALMRDSHQYVCQT